jgi:orotate phosphoribosyltransferase
MDRATLIEAIASVKGMFQPGITKFDGEIFLPFKPIYLENIYAEKQVWIKVSEHASEFAKSVGAEVVVGAESAGIPLAASIAIFDDVEFAYVRKDGYRGHVAEEPGTRGAEIDGRKVVIIEDAIWTGRSIRGFEKNVRRQGGEIVGYYSIIDMRELAPSHWRNDDRVFGYCGTYFELLDTAVDLGVFTTRVRRLIGDFIEGGLTPEHPDWVELDTATFGVAKRTT